MATELQSELLESGEEMQGNEVMEDDEDEDNIYEVERIVGMKTCDSKGTTLYKVRWSGYGPAWDTWEPYENLESCVDMIEAYQKKLEERRASRQSSKSDLGFDPDVFSQEEGSEEDAGQHSDSSSMSRKKSGTKPSYIYVDHGSEAADTLKDKFWRDLEQGKINVFGSDMYSKVKGQGRAARPTTFAFEKGRRRRRGEDSDLDDDSLEKRRKHKKKQKTGRKSAAAISRSQSNDSEMDRDSLSGQKPKKTYKKRGRPRKIKETQSSETADTDSSYRQTNLANLDDDEMDRASTCTQSSIVSNSTSVSVTTNGSYACSQESMSSKRSKAVTDFSLEVTVDVPDQSHSEEKVAPDAPIKKKSKMLGPKCKQGRYKAANWSNSAAQEVEPKHVSDSDTSLCESQASLVMGSKGSDCSSGSLKVKKDKHHDMKSCVVVMKNVGLSSKTKKVGATQTEVSTLQPQSKEPESSKSGQIFKEEFDQNVHADMDDQSTVVSSSEPKLFSDSVVCQSPEMDVGTESTYATSEPRLEIVTSPESFVNSNFESFAESCAVVNQVTLGDGETVEDMESTNVASSSLPEQSIVDTESRIEQVEPCGSSNIQSLLDVGSTLNSQKHHKVVAKPCFSEPLSNLDRIIDAVGNGTIGQSDSDSAADDRASEPYETMDTSEHSSIQQAAYTYQGSALKTDDKTNNNYTKVGPNVHNAKKRRKSDGDYIGDNMAGGPHSKPAGADTKQKTYSRHFSEGSEKGVTLDLKDSVVKPVSLNKKDVGEKPKKMLKGKSNGKSINSKKDFLKIVPTNQEKSHKNMSKGSDNSSVPKLSSGERRTGSRTESNQAYNYMVTNYKAIFSKQEVAVEGSSRAQSAVTTSTASSDNMATDNPFHDVDLRQVSGSLLGLPHDGRQSSPLLPTPVLPPHGAPPDQQVPHNAGLLDGVDQNLNMEFDLEELDLEDWDTKPSWDLPVLDVLDISNIELKQAVKEGTYSRIRKAFNSKKKHDTEQADSSGMTLTMIAAQHGFDDILELLVLNGTNINAQQKNGTTALMHAAEQGHLCTVSLLLEMGAHMNVQQNSGDTALMKATRRCHFNIVKLLLENGANFSVQSHSDNTALKIAKMGNYKDILDLINNHISKIKAAFESQVMITLNNTANIQCALFPMQCFSLCEAEKFHIHFKHELQPTVPGVGTLLFIAHARITPQETKCRFYGPCAVLSVYLNGIPQPPLTEEANFVLSFSPLLNGRNELEIRTVAAPTSKAKLVVCAYKAQLTSQD